jgi:hypothetical protein
MCTFVNSFFLWIVVVGNFFRVGTIIGVEGKIIKGIGIIKKRRALCQPSERTL